MALDPLIAGAVAATGKWLWDSYGKAFTDELVKRVGVADSGREKQRAWEAAAESYLSRLYEEVNWLHVLGRPEGQALERIYTDVNVLDKLSAERRYSLEQLEAEFVPRQGWRWREKERRDGLQVVDEYQRLFILGKPGAGKTTFLKHVTLQTIKQNGRESGQKKLPFFVSLKELSDTGVAILPFMAAQLRRAGFEEAETLVRQVLQGGDGVMLFDGLDEVNAEMQQRANLTRDIQYFVDEFDACQVLVTCRLAAADYLLKRFEYVEMADFNEIQQKTFVFGWFEADKVARDACWQALQGTRNETLRELAQVPMLLSLLCLTFEERKEFPPNRDEIYSEATRALLLKWDSTRNIQRESVYGALTLKFKDRLLARIAEQTFAAGEYFIPKQRLVGLIESYLRGVPGVDDPDGELVLQAIEAQHGLLVERAHGIHSFSHLTLQEYFAARYYVEHDARNRSIERLMSHVGNERWREVFLLTAGMLPDATDFCQQYIIALQRMISADDKLLTMLQWADSKSVDTHSGVRPAAVRAFALFPALVLARTLAPARALAAAHALTRSLALALDRILDSSFAHPFDLVSILALDNHLGRYTYLDLARSNALALDLAVTFDLSLLTLLPGSTERIISHLRVWCKEREMTELHRALQGLLVPHNYAPWSAWKAFNKQLDAIMLAHWGIDALWELSQEQAKLLVKYLSANQLLIECMAIAYLPERNALENQLLLPP